MIVKMIQDLRNIMKEKKRKKREKMQNIKLEMKKEKSQLSPQKYKAS